MGTSMMYFIILIWTFVVAINFSSQQLSFEEVKPYRVNMKTATHGELCLLPRIGDKTASRIIELRNIKGIDSKEDLLFVRGLSEKAIEEFLPLTTWSETAP